MATYGEWLDGLTRYFFGAHYRDRRVRLVVTRSFLDQHFGYIGGTASFLNAMREGPNWAVERQNRSMHSFGLALYAQWKQPRKPRDPGLFPHLNGAPTYLPYLCLLCLAWTEGNDEDYAEHAYYNRLEGLFPGHALTHALRDWCKLWNGLEEWTNGLGGSWGVFKVEQLGGMPYVGIPKAQVIFTPGKIERMRDLFAALGLSPTSSIDEANMTRLLMINDASTRQCMGERLTSEVQRGTPLGKGAIDLLLEQLKYWDGSPSHRATHANGSTAPGLPQSPIIPVLVVLEASQTDDGRRRE